MHLYGLIVCFNLIVKLVYCINPMYMVNHNVANRADTEQTAPQGAVCSVSTLFAVLLTI